MFASGRAEPPQPWADLFQIYHRREDAEATRRRQRGNRYRLRSVDRGDLHRQRAVTSTSTRRSTPPPWIGGDGPAQPDPDFVLSASASSTSEGAAGLGDFASRTPH